MSSRTCELVAAAVLLAAGCGSADRRTIDVCGRGDRPELAAALAGGQLAVEVLDDDGDLVSSAVAPADATGRIELDFAGGERVRVTGRDAAGGEVALGEAALGEGGACVCLALTRQAAAACGGLTCVVEEDSCRFLDGETGEPTGPRVASLAALRDTVLVAAEPEVAHADAPTLAVARARAVALLAFDMTQLPARSIIHGAELELGWDPPEPGRPPRPLSIHRVAEAWDDDATWLEWSPGQSWSVPGCDGEPCAAAPLARMATDGGATTRSVPIGRAVAAWLDPAMNHGLAVRSEGNPTALHAAESSAGGARLLVTFHLPDDGLDDPGDEPICGNGLVEADEECDDGDRDDDDACTGCRIARCGDGVVRAGVEECDHDGSPDESCTAACLVCADPDAASTWVGESGTCYHLFLPPVARQFGGAEAFCDDRGHGHLAALGTPREHDEVIAGLRVPATTSVWMGLSDRDREGEFLWSSDFAQGGYDRWAATEPSGDPGEDCVVVTGGRWSDAPCDVDHGFMCERNPWRPGEGGRVYRTIRPVESFPDAELVCEAARAHLAAPTTAEELAAMRAALPLPGTDGFIGLGELDADGELSWVTGEAADFLAFTSPPALDGDQFCAHIDRDEVWLVAGCSRLRRFVCESD
ncbi:MAG TPA: lectin-like protein [Kofleriaceae bacterium]|nr:lectin-like protein [Kofleriaceae bacterium]